jgi:hypothetical protein
MDTVLTRTACEVVVPRATEKSAPGWHFLGARAAAEVVLGGATREVVRTRRK